jgi:hypothetical protein
VISNKVDKKNKLSNEYTPMDIKIQKILSRSLDSSKALGFILKDEPSLFMDN